MKHLASILRLSALLLLCGCGGGEGRGGSSGPPSPPSPTTPSPPSQSLSIGGNWQFSTTSAVPGMASATLAGSITQSGSSVSGAVHVGGSNCFDQLTTIGLTGTLTGNNVSLTSTSVAGQVITITGNITNSSVTGMYSINGGCANGDQGNVTGFKVPAFSGTWRSGFEINEQHFFGLATVTQDAPNSEGTFGVAGTVDDNGGLSCLRGRSRRERFLRPATSWARLWPLKLRLPMAPSVSLGR